MTAPLRLASYGVLRTLELLGGSRHPHGRVVAQARALVGTGAPVEPPPSARVLFFTVRGWYIHVGTEVVLAKALQARGAAASFFLCGGKLAQCDFKPGTDPAVTRPLCWRCSGFARRLLDAFELPFSTLADVVDDSRFEEARRTIAGLSVEELRSFRYRDLPLFEFVQPSVQRSLLRGDVGEDSFSERVLRGFLESAIVYVHACEELLDRDRPDVVVMTNGLFFAERIMLELARARGTAAVTYERGMPVHTVLFDHNQPAIRFDLDRYWPQARERPLSPTEERRLDAYLSQRAGGQVGVIDLWPSMEDDLDSVRRRLGLGGDRPLAVLYTNVLWDSAVFGRDVAFDGMFEWLAETVRVFAGLPDLDLLIRVHPSEIRIPMSESRDRACDRIAEVFPVLPPNVKLVPPGDPASSYTLMELADAVLVYTSTIGLEAAVRGKPVIVAGRTHYRGRGCCVEIETRAEYPSRIVEATRGGPLDAIQVELARRYADLFFFRFQQPFPWIIDTPRSARRLAFSDLADLAPGQDAQLDRMCAAILTGAPFVAVDPPA